MSDSYPQPQSSYRWVILGIVCLATFIGMYVQFQVAALAYKLTPLLKLTSGQFASILTAPMLTSVFLSIAAGMIADRFGVKRLVTFGFIFAIAGTFLRVIAHSYFAMFSDMFLCGLVVALLNANITKLLAPWFSKDQMGTAVGFYMASASAGTAASLGTTAMFPSINSAFITTGVFTIIVALLWVAFIKDKPAGVPDLPIMPATRYLGVAAKSRNVWLTGVSLLFYWGGYMAFSGFLPNALTTVRGINPVTAGVMASVLPIGILLGNILGPIISDRLGVIKPVVISVAILGAVTMYGSWMAPRGAAIWILLILTGILLGASVPMLTAFPMLLPEIGPVYAGSAGGLIATIQLLGAFFIPSFVIAALAGTDFSKIFALSSLCILLLGITVIFLPEVGAKARAKAAGQLPG